MAAVTPTCASCVFGATQSSLLSLSYHAVETITVSVQPYITVYANGSRSTSLESITETQTDFVGRNGSKTYTNLDDITWTYGDATLTYPTTYVHYLGFEGASISANAGQTCAQQTAVSAVSLPDVTDAASFIYPLAPNSTAMALPMALLEYLQQLPPISSQFHGEALTGCAPLGYAPVTARHVPEEKPRRFEGARRTAPAYPPITPTTLVANSTLSSIGPGSNSSSFAGSGTGVHGPLTHRPGHKTTPGVYSGGGASTTTEVSRPIGPITPQSSLERTFTTETHTTAFVIQPITGKPIVTSIGSAHHHHSSPGRPGGSTKGDGSPQHTTEQHSQAQQHTPSHPNGETPAGSNPKYKPTPIPQQPNGGNGHHTTERHSKAQQHSPSQPNGESPGGSHPKATTTPVSQKTSTGDKSGKHSGRPGKPPNRASPGRNGLATTRIHDKAPAPQHSDHQSKQQQSEGDSTPSHVRRPVYSAGNTVITAMSNGAVVYGSRTVKPGQSITIGAGSSKKVIVLQTSDGSTHLVVNGHTDGTAPERVAETPSPKAPAHPSQAVVTTDGHTFTAIQSGSSIILEDGSSTETILAGSTGTFDGQTIKVMPSGGAVVINGHTASLSVGASPAATVTAGGHAFTAIEKSGSILLEDGSSTAAVADGHVVTFDGQTFSALPGGSAIVVNGRTVELTEAGRATSTGVGGYIKSGLGGGRASASRSGPTSGVATNAASTAIMPVVKLLGVCIACTICLLVLL